jgi:hypothetical protein
LAGLLECIPESHRIHKAFFEIAVPAHNACQRQNYVVIIEKNTASVYDAVKWGKPLAVGKMQDMPADKNGMRSFTLAFVVQAANDDSIWLIIDDQYRPAKLRFTRG